MAQIAAPVTPERSSHRQSVRAPRQSTKPVRRATPVPRETGGVPMQATRHFAPAEADLGQCPRNETPEAEWPNKPAIRQKGCRRVPELRSWTRPWRRVAGRHPVAMLCILPALALAIFCATAPAHPLLTTDSPGYLYFTAGRPAGYPALLWLVRHITGRYQAVRPAQAALYCAAAVWLGAAARQFAGSMAAALALQALLLAYPAPLQLADQIMADSLSATVTVLFAAQALRIAVTPSPRNCALAAALAGLGVLVRPDNLALFPAALLLATCAGAARFRTSFIALAWLTAGLAITPLSQLALRRAAAGDHRLGREVMQKALFLPAATATPGALCDADYIDTEAAPMIAYWRAAPAEFQDVLRLRISNLLRYEVIIPSLLARHGMTSVADAGPILMCYTLIKARAAPGHMLAATAHEYRNLILNYTFVRADWQHRYTAYVRARPPPLPALQPLPASTLDLRQRAEADVGGTGAQAERDNGLGSPRARNGLAVFFLNAIQAAGCAASCILIVLATPRLARATGNAPSVIAGAALGLALQLHLLAIAAIEIAEPRYMFPLWPLVIVPLFIGAVILSRWKPYRQADWNRRWRSKAKVRKVFFFEKKRNKKLLPVAPRTDGERYAMRPGRSKKCFGSFFQERTNFLTCPEPRPAQAPPAAAKDRAAAYPA
jgi:hypothetical protein